MWGRASYRNSLLQSARLVALSLNRQREVADALGLVQARRSHLSGWWSHRLPVTTVGASGKAGGAQLTGGCNLGQRLVSEQRAGMGHGSQSRCFAGWKVLKHRLLPACSCRGCRWTLRRSRTTAASHSGDGATQRSRLGMGKVSSHAALQAWQPGRSGLSGLPCLPSLAAS